MDQVDFQFSSQSRRPRSHRLQSWRRNPFPASAALYEALLREGESVARALGITLHGDTREMIAEGARAAGKRNVSMLMDI